jgi:DamX protein
MTIAHEMAVLELESQTELLSRIQFLTRFGSNLVHISGPAGSGKTWLAQRYLEKWSEDQNQALLMTHASQSVSQQRSILLKQLVSDPLFNEHDPIMDSLGMMLAGQNCNILIVIDDAHLLSHDLIAELWTVVQKAQTTPNWQISVLLFSEHHKIDKCLSQLSYGQENKPLDLDIETLTVDEAKTFVDMLVVRHLEHNSDKMHIRQLVGKSSCLPGELMALGNKKTERRIIIRSIIQSPVKTLIAILILLLLVIGGYLVLSNSNINDETIDDSEVAVSTTSDSLVEEGGTVDGEQMAMTETTSTEPEDTSVPSEDVDPLPQEILEDPMQVGTEESDQQRVVVPSNVVDALIDNQHDNIDTEEKAKIEAVVTAVVPTAPTEESIQQAEDAVLTTETLKAIPPTHYTLQVAATTELDVVNEFIAEHQLAEEAYVHKALRQGETWYIISVGDYAYYGAAKDALPELKPELKTVGAWVKSFATIHKEIDSDK